MKRDLDMQTLSYAKSGDGTENPAVMQTFKSLTFYAMHDMWLTQTVEFFLQLG